MGPEWDFSPVAGIACIDWLIRGGGDQQVVILECNVQAKYTKQLH